MYIVYTGISHVTAILLVVWARFGFTVELVESDNELPFFKFVQFVHLVTGTVGLVPDLMDAC